MVNSPAPALALRDGDRDELASWTRSTTSVWKWRNRSADAGLVGLVDAPRAARPKQVDDQRIITATLTPLPRRYGVTHWSCRFLATHLKVGNATIARAWRMYGVQPWRFETFKFSTEPEFVGNATEVVGPYLVPPENAIVLCVDEKSQIQALDRTAPMLPMRIGDAVKRTHDYRRHGTTTLFAALEIATEHVNTGAVKPKHRKQEFLAFLRQLDRAYPERELHLVMDNYATHKTPRGEGMAREIPTLPFPLHFYIRVLAEPRRGLVWDHP